MSVQERNTGTRAKLDIQTAELSLPQDIGPLYLVASVGGCFAHAPVPAYKIVQSEDTSTWNTYGLVPGELPYTVYFDHKFQFDKAAWQGASQGPAEGERARYCAGGETDPPVSGRGLSEAWDKCHAHTATERYKVPGLRCHAGGKRVL